MQHPAVLDKLGDLQVDVDHDEKATNEAITREGSFNSWCLEATSRPTALDAGSRRSFVAMELEI